MAEAKIVQMPGAKAPSRQRSDESFAKQIRSRYRKLCTMIDAATKAGLEVDCSLNSKDTYGGGLVRTRDISITRKVK